MTSGEAPAIRGSATLCPGPPQVAGATELLRPQADLGGVPAHSDTPEKLSQRGGRADN